LNINSRRAPFDGSLHSGSGQMLRRAFLQFDKCSNNDELVALSRRPVVIGFATTLS